MSNRTKLIFMVRFSLEPVQRPSQFLHISRVNGGEGKEKGEEQSRRGVVCFFWMELREEMRNVEAPN